MEIKNIKMERMDSVPLARAVPMPHGYLYPRAAVSVYFDNMSLSDGLKVKSRDVSQQGEDTAIQLEFESSHFVCDCIVETKPDPDVEIDTGGNLRTLQANEVSPEKEQWLEQARQERTRLAGSANGQKLLIEYGKHNEVYDKVFKSRSFSRTWKANGLTERMSRDTYEAVKNNTVINDKVYTDTVKGEVTYNAHAFYEQTALSMATLLADPNYDPHKPSQPSEYTQASEAALKFGSLVNVTGNEETTTTPITPEEVYAYVEKTDQVPLMARSTVDINRLPHFYAAQSKQEAQGMLRSASQEEKIEDPYGLRELYDGMLKERVEQAEITGHQLYKSSCTGLVPRQGFGAQVIVRRRGGEVVDIKVEYFSLPEFDLAIDDSLWDSTVAQVIRPHLQDMAFLHNYLHQAISRSLSKIIWEVVARDENFYQS